MTDTSTPSTTLLPGVAPTVMPLRYDLATLGYLEEEHLLEGTATSYTHVGARDTDGKWQAEPAGTAPYRTRLLVRRPTDPGRFSGTVTVEWLNVSGGLDAAPDWGFLHRSLLRRGDAWVGVSAQQAGIDGGGLVQGFHLKQLAPDRYGQLEHPGDAFAFDLFTQAGRALRDVRGGLLGPLEPTQLIAIGESQSAMFLTTYVNAIDPEVRVFDAYLVHGRAAGGVDIAGLGPTGSSVGDALAALRTRGEQIRSDARVPVLVLQSETDVILLGGGRAEQTDSDKVRLWEIAGSAHADTYLLLASNADDGQLTAAELHNLLRPVDQVLGMPTGSPINAGPQQHYVGHAAYEHLVRWAGGGPPPPVAPRLDVTADFADLRRDDDGITTGGIRTPWVDLPTAVLSGLGQTGEAFSMLFGTTAPLPSGRLATIHPDGREGYLSRLATQLDAIIETGFLLADDRDEMLAIAECHAAEVFG
jgi:hypothetical protein